MIDKKKEDIELSTPHPNRVNITLPLEYKEILESLMKDSKVDSGVGLQDIEIIP